MDTGDDTDQAPDAARFRPVSGTMVTARGHSQWSRGVRGLRKILNSPNSVSDDNCWLPADVGGDIKPGVNGAGKRICSWG